MYATDTPQSLHKPSSTSMMSMQRLIPKTTCPTKTKPQTQPTTIHIHSQTGIKHTTEVTLTITSTHWQFRRLVGRHAPGVAVQLAMTESMNCLSALVLPVLHASQHSDHRHRCRNR